ncbi:MAG: DUF1273 domain-containing protein [Clostridiales bacterium]|jgi:uncharacterized phage-like protein YoqJ|nr:DUF1273 domain-containing protein [Clostridiales bacterium]
MAKIGCCFTGHRNLDVCEIDGIRQRLRETIIKLIDKGVNVFLAGGALGFDTIAALEVLEIRKEYPEISLILVLPCMEQTKGWSEEDRAVYDDIMSRADGHTYVQESYTKGCMFARNRRLVELSTYCLCYMREMKGGTAYTVKQAMEKGIEVINLAIV